MSEFEKISPSDLSEKEDGITTIDFDQTKISKEPIKDIIEIINKTGAFIAGSFVLHLLFETEYNDIDIFCPDQESFGSTIGRLISIGYFLTKKDGDGREYSKLGISRLYSLSNFKCKVDVLLIKPDIPFDFFGYESWICHHADIDGIMMVLNGNGNITTSLCPKEMEDIKNQKFTVRRDHPDRTQQRVLKYLLRGFTFNVLDMQKYLSKYLEL